MIWLRRGENAPRWDGHRLLGRPPVLAPPPWALAARIWQSLDMPIARAMTAHPEGWLGRLLEATPRRASSLVVVVPDATRVGAWRRLLPDLLRGLDRQVESGAARRVLIATGTHAPVEAEALRAHLGLDDELAARWAPTQNSEQGFTTHRSVGETSRGTPVRLHPLYLDAEFRVTLGDVSYHYFAGFGGGPKLTFPGLADPGGAARNHRHAVEQIEGEWPWRVSPHARAGELSSNPVHADLLEAAELAPPHWSLSVLEIPPPEIDPARPFAFPIAIEQGPGFDAWRRATERHDVVHRVPQTVRPKLLIVDAGGTPRDHTLLQAQKSLQHAARFADADTRILLVAELDGGLGSSALRAMTESTMPPLDRFELDRPDGLHVQTLTALRGATRPREVALWSELDPAHARALGFEPLATEDVAREYCVRHGRDARWGWLPRAERFLPARGWLGGGAASGD